MTVQGGSRRIDRILRPQYADGLAAMSLDELRSRRDECLAEREYLSLLRRLVQGRAEILKAEVERRGGTGQEGTLVERLSKVLSSEGHGTSRGEAVKVGLPEEEMLQAGGGWSAWPWMPAYPTPPLSTMGSWVGPSTCSRPRSRRSHGTAPP